MRVHKLTEALNNLSLKADTATYAHLLRQCRDSRALMEGKQLHIHIRNNGYENDTYISNLLIQMYASCHSLALAKAVFTSMHYKNIYTWNIMFSAYAQTGHPHLAKSLFDSMPERDSVSWNAALSMYMHLGDIQQIYEIFSSIPDPDVIAWTTMISAFAQNGQMQESRKLFDHLDFPNTVTWNVMIQAYSQRGELQEANELLNQMPYPDVVTYTALVTANAYHGDLESAREIFDTMPVRNTVSWNAILQGYSIHYDMEEAHSLFDQMPHRNVISWTCMVAGYAKSGYVRDARSMFDLMPEHDLASWNSILTAYSDGALLEEAKSIFASAPERNVVSWTALVKAYVVTGHIEIALRLPGIMDLEGVKPDEVTYIIMVDTCAENSLTREGKMFHKIIAEEGYQNHFIIATSLVNMYGKCGKVGDARYVFDRMLLRTDAAWNAMMLVYAQNERGRTAIELFMYMQLDGILPDSISYVTLLFACSHAGFVGHARDLFSGMGGYGIPPNVEHYVCVVDLLARAGRLEDACELVENMPFEADDWAWATLLSASKRSPTSIKLVSQ